MKLEAGKRYVRRDGEVTDEMRKWTEGWGTDGAYTWLIDGGHYLPSKTVSDMDIVSEYALGHKAAENTEDSAESPAVRQFSTGATRNLDHNKLDYEGFNCPMAQRAFAEYMHGHRKQADGTIRDSANWQAGIPLDVYAKSLIRHVHDFHCLHRGWEITRPEDGKPMPPDDEHKLELLCAIWFNVQGYIHEILKAQKKCDTSSAG